MKLTIHKLILIIVIMMLLSDLTLQKGRGGGSSGGRSSGGRSSSRSSGGYSGRVSSYATYYSYTYGRYGYVTVGVPGGYWWVIFLSLTFTIIFMVGMICFLAKCLNVHFCSAFYCVFCCKCGTYRDWDT